MSKKATVELLKTLPPLPECVRGKPCFVYASCRGWIAYGSGENVIIRNQEDPSECRVFEDHRSKVTCAAFSPNGEWVASGDEGGMVFIYGSGNLVKKLKNNPEGLRCCMTVNDIAWSADGKKIVAAGNGGQGIFGKVFSWDTGSSVGNVAAPAKAVLSVDFRPCRPFRLIQSAEDNTILFCEGPPFKYTHLIREHTKYPNRVLYSPDGSVSVSVGSDGKILVMDGKDGQIVKELKSEDGHKGAIWSFCFSTDGARIATTSSDKTVKIWDLESGAVLSTTSMGNATPYQQVGAVWGPDGLLSVNLDGVINRIDDEGKLTGQIHGHIHTTCLTADGKGTMWSGDREGRLAVWKDGLATLFTGNPSSQAVKCLAIAHDGEYLYSCAGDKIYVNNAKEGKHATTKIFDASYANAVATGKVSAIAAVALTNNGLVILRDGRPEKTLEFGYEPLAVAFSPDDSQMAVGGKDKKVHVYDAASWKEVNVISDHERPVTGVQFSPSGQLSSASEDLTVRVYTDSTGEKQINGSDWEFHRSGITGHGWSPDGSKVVSVAKDGQIYVWVDTVKGKTHRGTIERAHKNGIDDAYWLDDDRVVTIGGDYCIKTWKITKTVKK